MSILRKCDICRKEFDFGFSVGVSLQGGSDFLNVAKYRFDIEKQDICKDCFCKIKNMSNSLRDKNGIDDNIYGKYGCWWEGGTGVSPEGNQCGECYPNYEDKCPHLKKHRQIEEMAHIVSNSIMTWANEMPPISNPHFVATNLYNSGYRKQSEGEWIEQIKTTTNAKGMTARYTINFCSNCGYEIGTIRYRHKYCPSCGARMRKEDEGK